METQTQKPIASIVFRHDCDFGVRQYHNYLFAGWLHQRADQRDVLLEEVDTVKCISFDGSMSHEELMDKRYSSYFVTEDRFLQMLYLLIIEPDAGNDFLKYRLNKKTVYAFLLKTPHGDLAIELRWQLEQGPNYKKDGWKISAKIFGNYLKEYSWISNDSTLLA